MNAYKLQKANFFNVNSPLLHFQNNVTSQSGEDGIIEYIFTIINPENRYCVEFGAWDGKYLSNCYNLIQNKEWNGLFIEANPIKYEELITNHGDNKKVNCVKEFVEFDGQRSLENIMKREGVPQNFELLSIDVDGIDYFIWENLSEYKPKVVVIEFNPSVPNDVVFVQPKDNNLNQGSSLLALILLGKEKGYELVCCTSFNAIFVLKEYYSSFNISSNLIWHMYRPACDGRIFHGYDSTVYVCGMDRLIWSGVKLHHDDFQVLPLAMRKFGDAQSI